jgi:hypothetical protein
MSLQTVGHLGNPDALEKARERMRSVKEVGSPEHEAFEQAKRDLLKLNDIPITPHNYLQIEQCFCNFQTALRNKFCKCSSIYDRDCDELGGAITQVKYAMKEQANDERDHNDELTEKEYRDAMLEQLNKELVDDALKEVQHYVRRLVSQINTFIK